MESRTGQHNQNKALKKEIAQARQSARGARKAQSLVVAGSLAVTLVGWTFFSRNDEGSATTVQATEPAPLVASMQQSAGSSATPLVTDLTTSVSQPAATATITSPTTTTATATPQAAASSSAPAAIASTRSSR